MDSRMYNTIHFRVSKGEDVLLYTTTQLHAIVRKIVLPGQRKKSKISFHIEQPIHVRGKNLLRSEF